MFKIVLKKGYVVAMSSKARVTYAHAVVIRKGTNELVCVFAKKKAELPGVEVRANETLAQAAVRGLRERTGIRTNEEETVFLFEVLANGGERHIFFSSIVNDFDDLYKGPIKHKNDHFEARVVDARSPTIERLIPQHRARLKIALQMIREKTKGD